MSLLGTLRAVPLFAELRDDDLERLAEAAIEIDLLPGEGLFAEGDPGEIAYVITEGEIEITKRSGPRTIPLAVRKPGEVIGEMALLQASPRSASARAKGAAALLAIPKSEIDALLAASAEAVRALFKVLIERWQSTQVLLAQSERMAQLGTLTAGLAHELNNPAAAVSRAVGQLRAAVDGLVEAERALVPSSDSSQQAALAELRDRVQPSPAFADAIARADLEADVEGRLTEAGVEDAWKIAPAIVDAGLADALTEVVAKAGDRIGPLVAALHASHEVASLLHEIEEGTRRLSAIVRALKSYSYLDQAPVQDVDLVAGIEDTLLILASKLEGIEVRREYEPDLPLIQGRGGELNQVWTNLIDNAAHALVTAGRPGGTVVIRVFARGGSVIVEVEDDGPGIPSENLHRVFDSFFTTKPPGEGTGLGLSISYGIVTEGHGGQITVESRPGRTVFRVELPRSGHR